MAFQSRFRETERHAFGERSGPAGDAAPGEPSEVRTNAIMRLSPETSPIYELHGFSLCFYS